jgi:hypothetical protein
MQKNLCLRSMLSRFSLLSRRTIYFGSSPVLQLSVLPPEKANRPSLFSKAGIKLRIQLIRIALQSRMGMLRMKLTLQGGFKREAFLKEACKLYETMCEGLATRDKPMLRKVTTPELFAKLDNEMKKCSLPSIMQWSRSASAPLVADIQTSSFVKMPGLDATVHEYYQVAVRFRSSQSIKETNTTPSNHNHSLLPTMGMHDRGSILPFIFRLKSSSIGTSTGKSLGVDDIRVTDYYVLERYVNDPQSQWRIASKIYPLSEAPKSI